MKKKIVKQLIPPNYVAQGWARLRGFACYMHLISPFVLTGVFLKFYIKAFTVLKTNNFKSLVDFFRTKKYYVKEVSLVTLTLF